MCSFIHLIEAGAVKLSGEDFTCTGKLQSFVRPHCCPRHAKEAMDFCMITDDDIKNGIEFPEMVEKLAALYEADNTYFVSWGDADYKVLQQDCECHKIANLIAFKD